MKFFFCFNLNRIKQGNDNSFIWVIMDMGKWCLCNRCVWQCGTATKNRYCDHTITRNLHSAASHQWKNRKIKFLNKKREKKETRNKNVCKLLYRVRRYFFKQFAFSSSHSFLFPFLFLLSTNSLYLFLSRLLSSLLSVYALKIYSDVD